MLSFKQFKSTKSSSMMPMIEDFSNYCMEYLQLEEAPQITIVKDGSIGHAFGCYSEGEIKLNIINRHPMDVLRTLAHEFVHYRQDMNNELHELSGETGSEHENEANSMAGILMRNFGRANPEYFAHGAILENYITELGTGEGGEGGFGGGPGKWHPPTVLRHEETGKQIKVGDTVTTFRGERGKVKYIAPPRHEASSGHIETTLGYHYASVYGCKFYHV